MPLMVCLERCSVKVSMFNFFGQWFAYGIQTVDKTGLSTQATFGIRADTHMVGNDYAWRVFLFPHDRFAWLTQIP